MLMQRSEKTQELIDYLEKVPMGEIVEFQQLVNDCEWDRKKQSHLLQSAIKTLAYNGIIFQSLRRVGYIRLDPSKGISRVREWHGGQVKNSTKRMFYKVESTDVDGLDDRGKRELSQARAEVTARQALVEFAEKQRKQEEYLSAKETASRQQQDLIKTQQDEYYRKLREEIMAQIQPTT